MPHAKEVNGIVSRGATHRRKPQAYVADRTNVREEGMSCFSFRSLSYWAFLGLFCVSPGAETVLHNVNGYTSSSDGIREFSVLVFDDSGKILRDDNGQATSVFIDTAMALIDRHLPEPDNNDYREALLDAVDTLVAQGMTAVHDAGIDLMTAEAYISLADNGELGMRIYAMISDAGEVLDAIGTPVRAYGDDRLEITSVKLYADGALGSLEPGKWADFILIDRDYFLIAASEIDDIRVLQTWAGGEKVYDATKREVPNDC
jgi:predicted amidohydrolase YtcJ